MPWLLVVLLVVLAAGCGEAGGEGRGRLVVQERLPAMPMYVEGSLSYLRVSRDDEVLVDGAVTDGVEERGSTPLFDRELAAGEYRVVSWQRPCSGNCNFLDPPTDRCSVTADVAAGQALVATVVLRQRGGCTIRVRSADGAEIRG